MGSHSINQESVAPGWADEQDQSPVRKKELRSRMTDSLRSKARRCIASDGLQAASVS